MNVTESRTESEVVSESTVGDVLASVVRLIKFLTKKNRKLVEHLNRISNLCPGNQRIWKLTEIVMTLETDAELALQDGNKEVAGHLADLALYVARLQYDLADLRAAIRNEPNRKVGKVDYVAGKYDPDNWRGPRP